MPRIHLDENFSPFLAEGLNLLCRGYFDDYNVISTCTSVRRGATDTEIVPVVGNENGFLVTRDNDFKKVAAIAELCRVHNVGVFFLKMPKGHDGGWEMVRVFFKHLEQVIEICKTKKGKHFYAEIRPNSVTVSR